MKPRVLIYAEPLLSRSMTFIRSQTEALNSFTPYYISPRYMADGLPLPKERVVVMRNGQGHFSRLTEVTFKALGFAPLFVRRLRKLRPALIHAHFGPMGLRALPLARKLAVPLVVTFHGYDATMPDERFRDSKHYAARAYLRRRGELAGVARPLIAVSNFVREALLRQGFPGANIVVHYIGVDTEFFRSDPSVSREAIVLFVGRLHEVKGCAFLIRAMEKVQSALPGARLVVIGDGPLRTELQELAIPRLRDVQFLGYQPPEAVRHWMNRASVFAAPSVRTSSGSEEGLPTVLVEAQAMGLPAVSSLSGGIPEAVAHGETGLLAQEKDWQGLAENILQLLQNETLWQRMSDAGRRRVQTCFDLKTQARKLESIYESVLARHMSAPVAANR